MSKRSLLILVLAISSCQLLALSTVAASSGGTTRGHGRQSPGGQFKPDAIPFSQVTFERSVKSHSYKPVVEILDTHAEPPTPRDHYHYFWAGTPAADAEAAMCLANQSDLPSEWNQPDPVNGHQPPDSIRVTAPNRPTYTGLGVGDIVTSLGLPTMAGAGGSWVVSLTGSRGGNTVPLTFTFATQGDAQAWTNVITTSRNGSRERMELVEYQTNPAAYTPILSCELGLPCTTAYAATNEATSICP